MNCRYTLIIALLLSLSTFFGQASQKNTFFQVKELSDDGKKILFKDPVPDPITGKKVSYMDLQFPYYQGPRLDHSKVCMVQESTVTLLEKGQHLLVGPLSLVTLAVIVASGRVEVASLFKTKRDVSDGFIKYVASAHKPGDFTSMVLHTNTFDPGLFFNSISSELNEESKRTFLKKIKNEFEAQGYKKDAIKAFLNKDRNWANYADRDFIAAHDWALVSAGDTDAPFSIHSICPVTSLEIPGATLRDRFKLLEEVVCLVGKKRKGKVFEENAPKSMSELVPLGQEELKNTPSDLELLLALMLVAQGNKS